ncbi:acyl-CoA dehydrogenase family protein [Labrys wisconsinensis]|uniref:Acyl-CoA dehydrogenase n=1 Tax=Labrys wisconsinensis TaxID=425677 RepID=A0ABU0J817_9HYPH|nr:acyl-CoA dehydrogenase family protein [Labrys wisconsinensis]MDQ0470418.1 putative acyl-CoA dehydrogenase [Labrys wisconsinensis]
MTARAPTSALPTHMVANQPPPLVDVNLFETDPGLTEALRREGAGWAEAEASAFGAVLGREETIALGEAANRFPPQLKSFDRYGRRLDEVEYHPAYHALMALGLGAGIHALPWTAARPGAHVAHAALEYMLTQVEAGVCCPITMTYAGVPALRQAPALEGLVPLVLGRGYDGRAVPVAAKGSATIGMAMTEKQGGSDVRANTTRAVLLEGDSYALTGHKWFCSAPMSDAFLTLAQTGAGLTCFLVPRWRPDGTRNGILLQRLKDKLGNRSNASAEIEYDRAWAQRIGEEGRGIAAIMEMVRHTRLDAAVVSAGMMRQGVVQAAHHAAHRSAFGRLLIDQPAMRAVLADLALEAEAALALVMRVARAFDGADEAERAFARIGSALAKFWVTKRLPGHAYEALECLGGNGYVEEAPMARLYREAPVNAIWEGSGNVNALDVLRALGREPGALTAWRGEAQAARGALPAFDRFFDGLDAALADLAGAEATARRLVEDMALALQASLLLRHAPAPIGEAFVAARIGGGMRGCYGALPAGLALDPIIARARVA